MGSTNRNLGWQATALLVVTTLVGAPGAWAAAQPSWTATPELRITLVDVVFVPQALLLDRDTLMVLDRVGGRVLQIDGSTGRLVGYLGRQGTGPGEFRSPVAMGMATDTLWVMDPGNARFTAFTRAGRLAGTVAFDRPQRLAGRFVRGWTPIGTIGPGRILAEASTLSSTSDTLERGLVGIFTSKGNATEPVLVPRSLTGGRLAFEWAGGRTALPQPFATHDLVAPSPQGDDWWVIRRAAAAETGAPVLLERYDAAGGAKARTALRLPLQRLRRQDVKRAVSGIIDRLGRVGGGSAGSRSDRKALEEAINRPRYVPPVTAAVVASDGRLWLQRPATSDAGEWVLVSEAGLATARVRLPARARVLDSSSQLLWTVEPDEDGIIHLVRYTLRASGPS